jgi:hypothetical protein
MPCRDDELLVRRPLCGTGRPAARPGVLPYPRELAGVGAGVGALVTVAPHSWLALHRTAAER